MAQNILIMQCGSHTHKSARPYSRLLSSISRVRLQLGNDESNLPTNERIKQFSKNEDPSLLALYFEFGRYLLISSSRRGGQPANLQGIWNEDLTPPWSSKWTTNINLEMNYWQADAGDLWETEIPSGDLSEICARQEPRPLTRITTATDGCSNTTPTCGVPQHRWMAPGAFGRWVKPG